MIDNTIIDYDDTIKAFEVLGSDARIQILKALLDGPKRPSELAELPHQGLGLRYHCLALIDAGFILAQTVEKGRRVLYHLNVARFRRLAASLTAMADQAPVVPPELEAEAEAAIPTGRRKRDEIRVQTVDPD